MKRKTWLKNKISVNAYLSNIPWHICIYDIKDKFPKRNK